MDRFQTGTNEFHGLHTVMIQIPDFTTPIGILLSMELSPAKLQIKNRIYFCCIVDAYDQSKCFGVSAKWVEGNIPVRK